MKAWILAIAATGCSPPAEVVAGPEGPAGPAGPRGLGAPYEWVDQTGAVVSASESLALWSEQGDLWHIDRESGEWQGLPLGTVFFEGADCEGAAWVDPLVPQVVYEVAPQLLGSEFAADWSGLRVVRPPDQGSTEVCPQSYADTTSSCTLLPSACARRVPVEALLAISYRPEPFAGPLYPAPPSP
jgi:hypothetical protein